MPSARSGLFTGDDNQQLNFFPSPRPSIQHNRISDWVDTELCEAIRSLQLVPGTPLSEPKLAAALNVSRAPVREALTRLADQRLVTIVPQVGTRVAPIPMSDVVEACFIRTALERGAFSRAIQEKSLNLDSIREVLARNTEAFARRDEHAWFESDDLLHQEVFALAGAPHVWKVIRGVKVNLDRLRRLAFPYVFDTPGILAEHTAIVDALADRDESTGLSVISQHANRIIDESVLFQDRFPSYFTD